MQPSSWFGVRSLAANEFLASRQRMLCWLSNSSEPAVFPALLNFFFSSRFRIKKRSVLSIRENVSEEKFVTSRRCIHWKCKAVKCERKSKQSIFSTEFPEYLAWWDSSSVQKQKHRHLKAYMKYWDHYPGKGTKAASLAPNIVVCYSYQDLSSNCL